VLFSILFFRFIEGLGRKLSLLNFIALLASIQWLVAPVVVYHFFPETNHLAALWQDFMPIPSDEYFSYVLPATIAMCLGMFIPLRYSRLSSHQPFLGKAIQHLRQDPEVPILLVILAALSLVADVFVSGLGFLFKLLTNLLFVAVFYVYYSGGKRKRLLLFVVFGLLGVGAIARGMFGQLLFIAVPSFFIIALGKNRGYSYFAKLGLFIFGLFGLLTIQSIKTEYRARVWVETPSIEERVKLFSRMVADVLADPQQIFDDEENFFSISVRANQGLHIARVLDYIPDHANFSNGRDIFRSFLAVLVPRFIWPDKPEAGGKYNMARYAGYYIQGYSMNVSPVGEAYGNFNRGGGVAFMFVFGLLLNLAVNQTLKIAARHPSVLLWIPFLFYQSIKVETDVLTVFNSLFKAGVFVALLFWGFRVFFGKRL
jgi:hypothetical protein